jgi:RNA polymerase sigma-70 factor (ECF subfamily)
VKENEFIHIVNTFKDKLFRLAKRMLVSTEEAEDATQEVLFKLWRKKEKMEAYNNVEAFAMTMTKNYCLDKLKAKSSNNLKIIHSNYTDENSSLQKEIEVRDDLSSVAQIMNTLPEQQRLIVQLREIEQYEFAEISKVLDMKETAIRVALSRARKTIREQLIKKHNYGVR